MSNAFTKGRDLEKAYRILQENLVKQHPELDEASFLFESNVYRVIDGVRYEADILITVNKGTEFETIYIVECKNWDAKGIGAQEVTYLSAKVDAFKANRGILVGTKFTDSGVNRAAKEDRIELLRVTNDFVSPAATIHMGFELQEWREYVNVALVSLEEGEKFDKSLLHQGEEPSKDTPYVTYKGKRQKLDEFVIENGNILASGIKKTISHPALKPGVNMMEYGFLLNAEVLEWEMDMDEKPTHLYLNFRLYLAIPRMIHRSDFAIEKKGHITSSAFQYPCTEPVIEISSAIPNESLDIDAYKEQLKTKPDSKNIKMHSGEVYLNEVSKIIIEQLTEARESGALESYMHTIPMDE